MNWHLGGGTTPPKISETTGPMTMKFLPYVKLSEEAWNQKIFFWFRASLLSLTSGKNFMVIRSVVSEILGGGWYHPPQMLLHCPKEQMLLTVNSRVLHWQYFNFCCRLPLFFEWFPFFRPFFCDFRLPCAPPPIKGACYFCFLNPIIYPDLAFVSFS